MLVRTPIDRPGRILSILTVTCLILALIGAAIPARPASAGSSGDETAGPIDLIAMLPGVLDLEAAGLAEFTPSSTRDFTSAEDYVQDVFVTDDPGQIAEEIEAIGFTRSFRTIWADPTAYDEPSLGNGFNPQSRVILYITQFADADGAANAFTGTESGDEDLADADLSLGDEAEASEKVFVDEASGLRYRGVDITVRTGSLLIGVDLVTRDGSPEQGDEFDLAEELATAFVERIDAFDAFPTGTTALETVRFQHPAIVTAINGYPILDGAAHWDYYWDTAADRDEQIAEDVAEGATDRYEVVQRLDSEEFHGDQLGYTLNSRVQTYEDTDRAEAGFADRVPFWESGNWDVSEIDDAPEPGDESVAIEAVDPAGTDYYSLMIWRDGVDVHEFSLRLPTRFADQDALFAVVAAQTACRADVNCWRASDVPEAVLDDAGPLVSALAPMTPTASPNDDAATPTPAATDDPATYAGEDFPFALNWDEDVWTRDASYVPDVAPEGLRLDRADGGALFVQVITGPSASDAATCQADVADEILAEDEVEGVEPALDEDGDEIAGETNGYAFAAWTASYDGDPELDYVGCATLVDGETTVAFIYLGGTDDIDAQLSDVEAVVASYEAG